MDGGALAELEEAGEEPQGAGFEGMEVQRPA